MQSAKLSPASVLEFITAGNAVFTMVNTETGNRFTYRVQASKSMNKDAPMLLFVQGLTGPDNTRDYQYFGNLRRSVLGGQWHYEYAMKARLTREAIIVRSFSYVFSHFIATGEMYSRLEFWHEGRCGRCGRVLTVPESIASGIGPECARLKTNARETKHYV